MFSVWNSGTNLWTNLCLNILARYLHSITNFTKLKHAVRTNSICFLPELSVLVMFWGTVSQNCCRNIIGLLPKGSKPTVLNRLSLCLRHIILDLTPMNVLISIVIPANTMLGDFHSSSSIYQHLMNCILPIITYMLHVLEWFFLFVWLFADMMDKTLMVIRMFDTLGHVLSPRVASM